MQDCIPAVNGNALAMTALMYLTAAHSAALVSNNNWRN
jgi:hypothetical protein